MIAYCFKSGEIGIAEKVPEGAIALIAGTPEELDRKIKQTARLAYDNKTYLVPKLPEATSVDEALEVLCNYSDLLRGMN